jgi:hypothetical protein
MGNRLKKIPGPQPSKTRRTLAQNVSFLIDRAIQGGRTIDGGSGQITKDLSSKTLWNLRDDLHVSPRLSTIEAVAEAFGLEAYRLLIPGLTEEVLLEPGLARLLDSYIRTPREERDDLIKMAGKFAVNS